VLTETVHVYPCCRWNFINNFREVGPNWVSFPGYFKDHGYFVHGNFELWTLDVCSLVSHTC
jgi:hypothetical protein